MEFNTNRMTHHVVVLEELDKCPLPLHRISNITATSGDNNDLENIVVIQFSFYNLFALHTLVLKSIKQALLESDLSFDTPAILVDRNFIQSEEGIHVSVVTDDWAIVIDKTGIINRTSSLLQLENLIIKTFGLPSVFLIILTVDSTSQPAVKNMGLRSYYDTSAIILRWMAERCKSTQNSLSDLAIKFLDIFFELVVPEIMTKSEIQFFRKQAFSLERLEDTLLRFENYREQRISLIVESIQKAKKYCLTRTNRFAFTISQTDDTSKIISCQATNRGFEIFPKFDALGQPMEMQLVLGFSSQRNRHHHSNIDNQNFVLSYDYKTIEIISFLSQSFAVS